MVQFDTELAACESQRITDLRRVVRHNSCFRTMCMALISPPRKAWPHPIYEYIDKRL